MKTVTQTNSFKMGDIEVFPGEFQRIDLAAASLYSQTPIHIPVYIQHGKFAGPTLFVMGAIHGDEINSVEIVRRLFKLPILKKLQGTLLAIPIANVYGFIAQSRYLPDRRDLNRIFPGSKTGSLAARLAHLLINEIVKRSNFGIDLHTAAIHRENLPQIRVDAEVAEAERLAKAFGAAVILKSHVLEGSLRHAAASLGIPVLVFEAGEALRFNEDSIRIGVKGIVNVLREVNMLPRAEGKNAKHARSTIARSSTWLRAPASGIVQIHCQLGETITEKQLLGYIDDPFTDHKKEVVSHVSGIIIGKNNLPLVNEGDAMFHIACIKEAEQITSTTYIDPLLDGWT